VMFPADPDLDIDMKNLYPWTVCVPADETSQKDAVMSAVNSLRRQLAALGDLGWSLSPWAPAPRPHRAADVTAAFVTDSFGRPGAVVESVRDLDGTTGTTDRRRLGLSWNAVGVEAGLPDSIFVKSTPL